MSPATAVSVIIPAYNEELSLPRLLTSIAAARTRSEAQGRTVVEVPMRGIATARNAGALAASALVIAFVGADSQLHPM
jgi:glycosyltransferase involved in cell wall biosynthesis